MKEILEILMEIRPDVDFKMSSDFIDEYLLDSFDIMVLTSRLEEKFRIVIQTNEIIPENYKNIESIERLVLKSGER